MNKLAIFVEGQTEQIFAESLVRFIAGDAIIGVRIEQATGGSRGRPRLFEIKGRSEPENHTFFVLIYTCGQDERVTSDIRDRYGSLDEANFKYIVGIRDVFPQQRDDIQRIRDVFDVTMSEYSIEPSLILAVMETEAWFLAEHSHFEKIHENLTIDRIQQEFNFDPVNGDMQLRDHPSEDLANVYFLEAMLYEKTFEQVERTVNSLDFSIVQNEIAPKFSDLGNLVRIIETFFNKP